MSARAVGALIRSRQTCPYCRIRITPETAVLDHIIPVALGGVHGLVNLVACCGPCNSAKSSRDFASWLMMLDPVDRARAERLYASRYGSIAQGVLL
ncbi:MAG: HNH endonuclease [Methylobacterium mesophilicum]|nr:HNH endonuclease [Methylobacterium mesophilicum]